MRARVLAACLALLAAEPASAGLRPRYGGNVSAALPQARPSLDPARAASVAELFLASLVHQAPLARDADGTLAPVLLAGPPRSADDGRTFVLELREGLRFHDGRPLRAADLAASLERLRDGPWAALLLPVRALAVRSETRVDVQLAFAYPRWPEALAERAAGVLPAAFAGAVPPGAGPFRIAGAEGSAMRLEPFAGHAAGRPFLDGVRLLLQPDRRSAARLAATSTAALGPARSQEAGGATWIFVAPDLATALEGPVAAAIDRADLVRYFVPGAATALDRLLPAPHAAPRFAAPGPRGSTPAALTLLFDPAVEGHRQVAERVQLRLHDRGVQVRLEEIDGAALRTRTRAARYELALVQLPLPADPGLAAAALLHASGRAQEARRLLEQVGAAGAALDAAERATGRALGGTRGIVPLYAVTDAIVPGPGAKRLRDAADLADAWLLPEGAQ